MISKNYYQQVQVIVGLVTMVCPYKSVLVFVDDSDRLIGIKNDFWDLLKDYGFIRNESVHAMLGPINHEARSRVRIVFVSGRNSENLRGREWDIVLFLNVFNGLDPQLKNIARSSLRAGPMPLWFDGEKMETV